jgi:hypothetical protein
MTKEIGNLDLDEALNSLDDDQLIDYLLENLVKDSATVLKQRPSRKSNIR